MTHLADERMLRAAFAPARALEPSDAEVAHVLARAAAAPPEDAGCRATTSRAKPPRRTAAARGGRPTARGRLPRRVLPIGVAALLALAGGYAATPDVRAAIDDVAGQFSSWLGGDSRGAPGRPLGASEVAPDYFHGPGYQDPRVIAEAGGYKLYAARTHDGGVEFDLGDTGVGMGEVSGDAFLHGQVLIVLGPGAMQNMDPHGHIPLFGVTARSVKRVELTYDSGPPLRVDDVNGGFVLLAEPPRAPRAVVAYDAEGHELGRQPIDDSDHDGARIDWKQYGPPAPVIPPRCQPGAVGAHPPPSCPNAG